MPVPIRFGAANARLHGGAVVTARPRGLKLDARAVGALRPGEALHRLGEALALQVRGILDPVDAAGQAAAVVDVRPLWVASFEGVQYTLGRAWYAHLEEGRAAEYFQHAAASDEIVRATLPRLPALMIDLVALVGGAPARQRPGWCGPGVHVFPAGNWLAQNGGDVHFDTEGLTEEQIARAVPALSLVLMLQPPEAGGALRVWDCRYQGEDLNEPPAGCGFVDLRYGPGDLVVIDSYRLHQIQPFTGARDRISLTAHAVLEDGVWLVWF